MNRKLYLGLAIIGLLLAACRGGKNASSTDSSKAVQKKIQEKYAGLLGIDQEKIKNIKLYSFIDEWYGVPYLYAGKSKSGVDCSGFTNILYREVYGIAMAGSAASLYEGCKSIKRDDLEEGDLVFFKINSERISHVGVYLQNNKFVHASSKKGIIISDLEEAYYKKYYFKGGRPKVSS
jgi:murein DD-endopeptidase / murein LD-carboxypeptidase